MTRNSKNTDDYEVGYGKPPKHSRFRPGTSGNPRGRPKGTKSLRTIIHDTLFEKVKVTEGGKVRKMSRVEAILTGMVARGLKGDNRASESVLRLANQHFPPGEEVEPMKIYLQRFTDGEILGEYESQPGGQRKFVPSRKRPGDKVRAAVKGHEPDEGSSCD